ncbi:MAG: NAD-dependent epimerase/dehydratase family protein [Tetragenococcus koreensis]|uniref:NAD-dependent epimerase/dehydratase family protein n=1 Tax=Tetragenococcus halophilus TaxID=51669 RepID=UPI000CBCF4D0|nr:NAD-dependent epimerase/dehydratase family protein [Tetragenococcus halophilus]MDN6140747.1 NAD-dependent epimerase/dehydratase family protein [Tetragenococcus koreensis]MDN6630650.1 NAD-dependent epimerase/dehydratase family protein [Staphylococcus equorum]MCO7026728.1 NAD-dependent epimerase/dehydratase family protein [Tetragenococcus halophilus]MDN6147099.1 NAD-dependent epimerase/dehydratase family protein [Tetragenococcus koreensis]MDN6167142.1 NAD-dependent epimerase/dehydratase famil
MESVVKSTRKERFLVTGGAGFIGSNLVNVLVEEGHTVTIVDDLSMGKKDNIVYSKAVHFIEGSVTDKELMNGLLMNETFDYIFHFAAIASVAETVNSPVETHEINFSSVLYLLELCKKFQPNLKRFIFPSSAAVYGDITETPKKEITKVKPMTPYAVDKYSAERSVINYYYLYGTPTTVVRFFNVYGPNQNPNSPYSGVISILLDRFSRYQRGEEVSFNLYGDGKQTRDFVYVKDVIRALSYIINSPKTLGEVYNIGTSHQTSLNQVISELSKIFNTKLHIKIFDERKGDIRLSVADIDKLRELGFEPINGLYQGLSKLVSYTEQC